MIAAIYARKSTEQSGVADDNKSVTRQVENAKAFALRKGWQVQDEHVYVDDGISGAIFDDGRPGFVRLMSTLKPGRAPFDVLIMSEESRLGREQREVSYAFKRLVDAGVRIFLYLEDRERLLESATDKFMLSVAAFADEMEREKARHRTRDAMMRKAKAGHVTGGRVFGYDNVRVNGHVERRINDGEAAIVRRIFELAALGHGHRSIAHELNVDGAPSPRPQLGRPAGWGPGTVRDVLGRPLYRGVIEWDRVRRDGARKQHKGRANAAPLRVEAPQLRIISEDLAIAVDAIRQDRRERYLRKTNGRLLGGAAPRVVKHVLSGLLRCRCGGTFEAQSAAFGRRKGGVYVCSTSRRKGLAVCSNTLHLPIAETENTILTAIEEELLQASVFDAAIELAAARIEAHRRPDLVGLAAERDRLVSELANLAAAVAAGGDVPTLIGEIRARETRKRDIDKQLERPSFDAEGLRAALRARLDNWRRLLRSRPTHGHRILQTLLDGPIAIGEETPAGVPWSARGSLHALFGSLSYQMASPTGTDLSGQGPLVEGLLAIAS